MQPHDEAAEDGLLGSVDGLAMRLAIGGPRQLRRSGAVYLFSPGRVYVQWLQRWLLLDGFMLKCFNSCTSLKPKTTIPLQSAVVEGKSEALTYIPYITHNMYVKELGRAQEKERERRCWPPTATALAVVPASDAPQVSSHRQTTSAAAVWRCTVFVFAGSHKGQQQGRPRETTRTGVFCMLDWKTAKRQRNGSIICTLLPAPSFVFFRSLCLVPLCLCVSLLLRWRCENSISLPCVISVSPRSCLHLGSFSLCCCLCLCQTVFDSASLRLWLCSPLFLSPPSSLLVEMSARLFPHTQLMHVPTTTCS